MDGTKKLLRRYPLQGRRARGAQLQPLALDLGSNSLLQTSFDSLSEVVMSSLGSDKCTPLPECLSRKELANTAFDAVRASLSAQEALDLHDNFVDGRRRSDFIQYHACRSVEFAPSELPSRIVGRHEFELRLGPVIVP